jgi:hypothetical protein
LPTGGQNKQEVCCNRIPLFSAVADLIPVSFNGRPVNGIGPKNRLFSLIDS